MARVAGYAGGRVDALMMRVVDVLYSLPYVFFVILLTVIFGRGTGDCCSSRSARSAG